MRDKPEWLQEKDVTGTYSTIPPPVNILGRNIREPRARPVATVKFQYAQLKLQNWSTRMTLFKPEGEILPNFR